MIFLIFFYKKKKSVEKWTFWKEKKKKKRKKKKKKRKKDLIHGAGSLWFEDWLNQWRERPYSKKQLPMVWDGSLLMNQITRKKVISRLFIRQKKIIWFKKKGGEWFSSVNNWAISVRHHDQHSCSYFIFFFQVKPFLESTRWVTYGVSNLSQRREFVMFPSRSEVWLASPPPFSVMGPWKKKETRKKNERREIRPSFPREAVFSQASSLILLVDCSIMGFPVPWALLGPQSVIWSKMK